MNQNIETRNRRNSQFDNVLEEFNSDSEYNSAVPEVGAIIYANGYPFYGDGQNWNQLAKISDIPEGSKGAYAYVEEGYFISPSVTQNLTAIENQIFNDASTALGTLGDYNGAESKFYLRRDVMYIITISFASSMSSANAHAELFFGTSGIPFRRYSDLLSYPKGKDVFHTYSRTFQIVGDSGTEENGLILYIKPSTSGKLYGASYSIQRAF